MDTFIKIHCWPAPFDEKWAESQGPRPRCVRRCHSSIVAIAPGTTSTPTSHSLNFNFNPLNHYSMELSATKGNNSKSSSLLIRQHSNSPINSCPNHGVRQPDWPYGLPNPFFCRKTCWVAEPHFGRKPGFGNLYGQLGCRTQFEQPSWFLHFFSLPPPPPAGYQVEETKAKRTKASGGCVSPSSFVLTRKRRRRRRRESALKQIQLPPPFPAPLNSA